MTHHRAEFVHDLTVQPMGHPAGHIGGLQGEERETHLWWRVKTRRAFLQVRYERASLAMDTAVWPAASHARVRTAAAFGSGQGAGDRTPPRQKA